MQHIMRKIFLTTLALIVCCSVLKSQVYNLSLEESIEIAKKQSFQIQNLLQEKLIAEHQLKYVTARLKTRVTMNLTLPQYTEYVQQWECFFRG